MISKSVIIKNGTIVTGKKLVKADILIKGKRIARIGRGMKGGETIDAAGLFVLPGMIDAHVHLRDPGSTQKEDFYTGTRAAIAGGVTTVIDMPNNTPPTTTARALKEKEKIAKRKAVCDYGFHFGADRRNINEIKKVKPSSLKLYMASTTGPLLISDFPTLLLHFSSFDRKKPICLHAEDEDMIGFFSSVYKEHWKRRPPIVAQVAVQRAVLLAGYLNRRIHICHTTTEGEINIIKTYSNATCEVTPHHLFLSAFDEKRLGNFGEMNPPLRERREQTLLWKSLNRIDTIASDHAPHTRAEKRRGAKGVPGLETTIPLLLDAVNKKRMKLQDIVRLTAENPTRIFGIKKKGRIERGYHADLTLVDMKEKWIVRGDSLETKCRWTPFEGRSIKGRVKKVFLRGSLVFDGEVVGKRGTGKRVFQR